MSAQPDSARPTPPRLGERAGCLVVVACMAVLIPTAAWAVARPDGGIPPLVAALAGCFLLLRQLARRARKEAAGEAAQLRAIAEPGGEAFRRLLEAEGLGCLVAPLESRVRAAIRLAACDAREERPRACRIGGRPDLPPGTVWPRCAGQAMEHLAQLDLAEVQHLLPGSPLPGQGHLCFFYADALVGSAATEARAVIHVPGDVPAVATEPPADARTTHPARAIELVAYADLPRLHAGDPLAPAGERQAEAYRAIADYLAGGGGGAHHKLLGHAEPIQGAMELDCELLARGGGLGATVKLTSQLLTDLMQQRERWRLLLQLDSDPSVPWMWGDLGRIYFWIRDEDLVAQRFDRVVVLGQCH